MNTLNFKVGTHTYILHFCDESVPYRDLLPSHGRFCIKQADENPLFELTVAESAPKELEEDVEILGEFKTGNAIFYVARTSCGGYYMRIYSPARQLAAVFVSGRQFRTCMAALAGESVELQRFGLENAVMVAFTYAGAYRNVLMLHASVAVVDGRAFAFLGSSGTGKSTHCELWLKYIPGAERLNDDNPIMELLPNGEAWIFGTPWSGKTPVYKNEGYRAGGLLRLHQGPRNSICRLDVLRGYASLCGSLSMMVWDRESQAAINSTVNKVLPQVPCYDMVCLPDEDAARMSYATMNVAVE